MRKQKSKPTDSGSPVAQAAMLEVVENQLREGKPPAVREALDRLLKMGISRDEALKYIACCVACEIFDVVKHDRPYNEQRYVAALQALPTLPFENDGKD